MNIKIGARFSFTRNCLVVIMIFRESGDIYGSIHENQQAYQGPVSSGPGPGIDTPGLVGIRISVALLVMFSLVDFTPNLGVGTSIKGTKLGLVSPVLSGITAID
jgi:hypothetical protein